MLKLFLSLEELEKVWGRGRGKEIMDVIEKLLGRKDIKIDIRKTYLYKKAREEGLEEGRKEGIKEGRKEGIKEGRRIGLEEGLREGIKLLILGKFGDGKVQGGKVISMIDKLSLEELQALKGVILRAKDLKDVLSFVRDIKRRKGKINRRY